MLNLREFVKKGFIDAVGNMPEYWIRLNSLGWFEKGVLDEADLEEIQTAIDERNKENELLPDNR